MIRVLERSGVYDNHRPTDFEIADLRLSQILPNQAGILRIPSNAELGLPDSRWVYETDRFPTWSLCVRHEILYRKTASDERACPRCDPLLNRYDAWHQANRQAIRFVKACELGHIDDVDWVSIIPHSQEGCAPSYLHWRGAGGALRQVYVVCPSCGSTMNLGIAYSRPWRCSGRYAERGRERPGCDRDSKIIQRGAANLHIQDIETALTIPPRSTALHRLLEMNAVQAIIVARSSDDHPLSKEGLISDLTKLADAGLVRRAMVEEIDSHDEDTIAAAAHDVVSAERESSPEDFRLSELQALQRAALDGAPPEPSPTPGSPPLFEVNRTEVRTIPGPSGREFRVTPVSRLRVVMVQTGYRRLDPLNPTVDLSYFDGQRPWYPGVELFGEGIFIDLAPSKVNGAKDNGFDPQGMAAESWRAGWADQNTNGMVSHGEAQHMLYPTFIWWHSLSHRLINALSIDSGYSSAAVRERVYTDLSTGGREPNGGVLLYTTQPGGDGTLGGLIALVPEFESVFDGAVRDLDACSNDPLCGEEQFMPGKYNGAACYACALVSETSCEHRNMFLDRHVLLENW